MPPTDVSDCYLGQERPRGEARVLFELDRSPSVGQVRDAAGRLVANLDAAERDELADCLPSGSTRPPAAAPAGSGSHIHRWFEKRLSS